MQISIFLFLGIILLVSAFLYKYCKIRIPRGAAPFVASSALTLSACLAIVSFQIEQQSPLFLALILLWSFFGGLGIALLCIECGSLFRKTGAQKTLFCGMIATVLSSLGILAFEGIPLVFSQIILVACSLACAFLMMGSVKRFSESSAHDVLEDRAQSPYNPLRVPWKLTITVMIWTASFGAMSYLFSFDFFWKKYGPESYIVSVILLVIFLFYLRMNFNDLIYKVGFLIVGFGIASILFARELLPVGYVAVSVGYRFIELLVWGLYVHLIYTRGLSAFWTVSLNVGIWTLGRYAGYLGAGFILGNPEASLGEEAFAFVLLVELLLLVSALFLSSHNNFIEGWGMENIIDQHRSERQLEYCCETLAVEYGLTLKEKEILAYVAKGMTRSEISEKLVVSPETTKTHIRHIYQKMEMNSREKILDRIDKEIDLMNEQ